MSKVKAVTVTAILVAPFALAQAAMAMPYGKIA